MKQFWLVLALAVFPRPAAGEPLLITSGSLSQMFFGAGRLTMTSERFDVTTTVEIAGGPVLFACAPCLPGDRINISSRVVGPGLGSGSFDETAYPRFTSNGSMDFLVAPVEVPALPIGVPPLFPVNFTVPFTMSGIYSAEHLGGSGPRIFSSDVVGTGFVTVTLNTTPLSDGQSGYFGRAAEWTFSNPIPTPEPGTLLLIVAGGAIGVRTLHKRRSNDRADS